MPQDIERSTVQAVAWVVTTEEQHAHFWAMPLDELAFFAEFEDTAREILAARFEVMP